MSALPEGWIETTLGEHCLKIGSGSTPRGGNEAYKQEGISLIRSQNILDFDFSYKGLAFIDDEQASKLSNVEIFEDDVLINITGDSVARVCSVPEEALPARVNQHVAILRTNKQELSPIFLRYYLLNPIFKRHLLILANSGGTRNALTKNMLEMLELNFPPLPEQKAIAEMLSSFDEKIELLRAQNKTLKTLAQTIFKEWFVNFNYPDLSACGHAQADATGEMVDSELGEIPKGWRVGKLSDFGRIICGKTPSKAKAEYFGGDVPFIKIPDMHNNMFIVETTDTLTQEGKASQALKTIPKSSISVSCIATVGLVSISIKESQTNQQINTIIPKEEHLREFIFLDMQKKKKYLMDIGSGGTATLNVNTGVFSNIEVVIPSDDVLKLFSFIVAPTFEKILENYLQIQTLSKTRNTLLPRLMNGQVRLT